MENNPVRNLRVVTVPLPSVQHNPFLRMEEIPSFLRVLHTYQGSQVTQLAVRLLLLTGVRTGELRLATPAQFDLERGLWIIPAASLKQRMTLTRKQRKRVDDTPYIVPLSSHAQEIVKQLLNDFKPAQKVSVPKRAAADGPHEREHRQLRPETNGLRRSADRAWVACNDVDSLERDRLSQGMGRCSTVTCRSESHQSHLQPRAICGTGQTTTNTTNACCTSAVSSRASPAVVTRTAVASGKSAGLSSVHMPVASFPSSAYSL
ncbi:phage integrase family protein [Paraburkholderia xenovorans LB400]|nr:phage integrase family protein [Paraburkholderia xenovorans LB400]